MSQLKGGGRTQVWASGGGVQSAAIAALIVQGKLRPDLISRALGQANKEANETGDLLRELAEALDKANQGRIAAQQELLSERERLTLLAKEERRKAGKALEDAERYAHIKVQFSPMSLDINGQHSWMWRGDPSSLKGPNIDVAVDAARKGGT